MRGKHHAFHLEWVQVTPAWPSYVHRTHIAPRGGHLRPQVRRAASPNTHSRCPDSRTRRCSNSGTSVAATDEQPQTPRPGRPALSTPKHMETHPRI